MAGNGATLESLIGQEAIDAVLAPIGEARGFPNLAYTSEDFYRLEQEKIFARSWVLAGFGSEIPQSGDMAPASVAGMPVLLLRDKAGEIRAYHNACRHRGARLLAAPCKRRSRITCPYHAWTYDFEGQLVARPYFDGKEAKLQDLPADPSFNLIPVRTALWHDLVFVNLSGTAPAFEDFLAPLAARLAPYDVGALRHAGVLKFELNCNWKFACENYIENYHVFAAHPRLLNFVPMAARNPGGWQELCFYNDYRFAEPEEGRGLNLPHYPDLPEDRRNLGFWSLLFPTLGFEVYPDQFAVFRVIPEGPHKTREEIHIYLMEEAAAGAALCRGPPGCARYLAGTQRRRSRPFGDAPGRGPVTELQGWHLFHRLGGAHLGLSLSASRNTSCQLEADQWAAPPKSNRFSRWTRTTTPIRNCSNAKRNAFFSAPGSTPVTSRSCPTRATIWSSRSPTRASS